MNNAIANNKNIDNKSLKFINNPQNTPTPKWIHPNSTISTKNNL
jgi:hypothetical protein